MFRVCAILCLTLIGAAVAAPLASCAVNGNPCPIPNGWLQTATWNLTESTAIQPSSASYFIPTHPWGLISLDWSVANTIWYKGNVSNTTCEATSTYNCQLLKQKGLAKRCFIYHNMELGLQWLESQRTIMYNPANAGLFLHTQGNPRMPIYNEPINFGDQYFWDFRNLAAVKAYVTSVVSAVRDPAVDGTFTDDVTGVPGEHPLVPNRTNLSPKDLSNLQWATSVASSAVIEALATIGKGVYQAFGGGDNDGPGQYVTSGNCMAFLREYCDPSYQGRLMYMQMDTSLPNKNQTVAAFLVTRPPIGFLGWGWESGDEKWDNIFLLQVGVPMGFCQETSSGVFTRQYTKGTAQLNCNTWTAQLPFPSL